MKRLFLFITLLLASCSGARIEITTPAVTQPSPTPVMVTNTPQPAVTLPPTATQPPATNPEPTLPLPPAATATSLPPAITAENAAQLVKLGDMNSTSLRKVVFSPDGKIFATAAGNQNDFIVKIWDSRRGATLRSFTGFSGIVWNVAFSPDGKRIASAADDQNGQHLRIWDAASGSQLTALTGPPTSDSLAFSPDGTRLAVGGLNGWPNGVIWIYDTATWQRVQEMKAPGQNVTALVYTQDGSQLISGGTDGKIRVWDLSKGAEAKVISAGKQANRLALSPNGRLLASNFCTANDSSGCTKGGIAIWRTSDWTSLQKFDDLAESIAFSANGSLLVSGSGQNDPQIRIRRVDDWTVVKTLSGEGLSVALSPDDSLLVTTSWDTISMWGLPR